MITKSDIRIEQLDINEIGLIDSYTKEHFTNSYIVNRPSQFEVGKRYNPHFLGIIGEWVFLKYMNPAAELPAYLKSRPLFQSDKGDFQLSKYINVDVKNQICNVNPMYLLGKDNFLANIEKKHLDKDFLTHFVLSLYNPEQQRVYIMGQISRDDLKKFGLQVKAGDHNGIFTWKASSYTIAYKHLSPINTLVYGV